MKKISYMKIKDLQNVEFFSREGKTPLDLVIAWHVDN